MQDFHYFQMHETALSFQLAVYTQPAASLLQAFQLLWIERLVAESVELQLEMVPDYEPVVELQAFFFL